MSLKLSGVRRAAFTGSAAVNASVAMRTESGRSLRNDHCIVEVERNVADVDVEGEQEGTGR